MICMRCEKYVRHDHSYDELHCKHCYTYLQNVYRRRKYRRLNNGT